MSDEREAFKQLAPMIPCARCGGWVNYGMAVVLDVLGGRGFGHANCELTSRVVARLDNPYQIAKGL